MRQGKIPVEVDVTKDPAGEDAVLIQLPDCYVLMTDPDQVDQVATMLRETAVDVRRRRGHTDPTCLHPVTVESNAMHCMSLLTGLTWDELRDQEVLWFIYRGRMRPVAEPGPWDGPRMTWACQNRPCTYTSPWHGRGGSRLAKEAVRQHLRDKHDLMMPKPQVVTTA